MRAYGRAARECLQLGSKLKVERVVELTLKVTLLAYRATLVMHLVHIDTCLTQLHDIHAEPKYSHF